MKRAAGQFSRLPLSCCLNLNARCLLNVFLVGRLEEAVCILEVPRKERARARGCLQLYFRRFFCSWFFSPLASLPQQFPLLPGNTECRARRVTKLGQCSVLSVSSSKTTATRWATSATPPY